MTLVAMLRQVSLRWLIGARGMGIWRSRILNSSGLEHCCRATWSARLSRSGAGLVFMVMKTRKRVKWWLKTKVVTCPSVCDLILELSSTERPSISIVVFQRLSFM